MYRRIWTGDNGGSWDHLAVSVPMILANGVGGMAWNGGKHLLMLSDCSENISQPMSEGR